MSRELIVPEVSDVDDFELDSASNHINDLIRERRFEEAEPAAKSFLEEYPFVIDGLDHLARIQEAKGNFADALKFYEEALAFSLTYAGFDEEVSVEYREKVSQIKKQFP